MKKPDWKRISQFDEAGKSPGFLLWQVSMAWRRHIENALMNLDLTHPQFVLLASVGWMARNGNAVAQIDLARHCKMDITMTSQVLRTLEKKGLIERLQRAGNERSKYPQLTVKGEEIIEKAVPLVEAIDQEFFGNQATRCVEVLQKVMVDQKMRFSDVG